MYRLHDNVCSGVLDEQFDAVSEGCPAVITWRRSRVYSAYSQHATVSVKMQVSHIFIYNISVKLCFPNNTLVLLGTLMFLISVTKRHFVTQMLV